MAFCKECGAQLSDHALFCGTCGARVRGQEEKRVCPNCGAEAPSHMIFCAQCGTRLAEAAAEDREQPARRTGVPQRKRLPDRGKPCCSGAAWA